MSHAITGNLLHLGLIGGAVTLAFALRTCALLCVRRELHTELAELREFIAHTTKEVSEYTELSSCILSAQIEEERAKLHKHLHLWAGSVVEQLRPRPPVWTIVRSASLRRSPPKKRRTPRTNRLPAGLA